MLMRYPTDDENMTFETSIQLECFVFVYIEFSLTFYTNRDTKNNNLNALQIF